MIVSNLDGLAANVFSWRGQALAPVPEVWLKLVLSRYWRMHPNQTTMPDFISWQKKLCPLLKPISLIYGLCMRLRAAYWIKANHGWTPPIPCISVGNISWGGTGKTPFCQYLIKFSLQHGLCPVILTRGYKANPPTYPYLVQPDDEPTTSGDEPLLLARTSSQARIIIDPDRTRAGKWALKHLNPDIFILDDGFQHLKVKRHLNLVLFSPEDILTQWNKVIPAGSWRESEIALKRADIFLINTWDRDKAILTGHASRKLARFNKPIFYFSIYPTELINLKTRARLSHLNNEPYILITSVANPQKVFSSVTYFLSYPPQKHISFPDHYHFDKKDFDNLLQLVHKKNIKYIVCTTKDAPKLKKFTYPYLLALKAEVKFSSENKQQFEQIFLKKLLKSCLQKV
jgi:tetraacyldisaccharide 4'-kinase